MKDRNQFQLEMEAEANTFNLKCLAVLCAVVVLCAWLNRMGIFTVDHRTMSVAVVLAAASFSLPILVWIAHDWRGAKTTILRWGGFKYLVVACAFIGITTTCIVLTFHAVLLMVLPGIFAAQYAYSKRLFRWALVGTAILVPIAVYGGYFFGLPDRNFFPDYIGDAALTFAERLAACPPYRALRLLEHFVLPRFLAILVFNIVLSGVIRRSVDLAVVSAENGEAPAAPVTAPVVTGVAAAAADEKPEYAGSRTIAAGRIVETLRSVAVILCAGAVLAALFSQEAAYRALSALTALASFFLISASRATQGHYRDISSAYMTGAVLWGLTEAFRIAALVTHGDVSALLAESSVYLSFLPDCLFVMGLMLFSKSEYNRLHYRRLMLHAFAISYMVFLVAQKLLLANRAGSGMQGFSKLSITLYFFVIVFTVVMVFIIMVQTGFKGHTFGTNCSAAILVVFNFSELSRLFCIISGEEPISLLAESVGVLGVVVYSWAQSDPSLLLRKREPEPIKPEDHVQNKVIWSAAVGFLLTGSILYVIGFFDTRDIYLILLAVLAYVVIYKSIQADVYNTELIEHQRMENKRLEELVNEKTAALEKANAHLKVISETDELTGLRNRRYGMSLLERLAGNAEPFAVLLMDLNHFKEVNDSRGHDVGDQVLRETGARLTRLGEGVTPIRLGGDEFLVIVQHEAVRERAIDVAEQICRAMDQPIETAAGELVVTACIGVAVWPEDTAEQNELFQLADKAMYGIKHRSGKSEYCVNSIRGAADRREPHDTKAPDF